MRSYTTWHGALRLSRNAQSLSMTLITSGKGPGIAIAMIVNTHTDNEAVEVVNRLNP